MKMHLINSHQKATCVSFALDEVEVVEEEDDKTEKCLTRNVYLLQSCRRQQII